MNDPYIGREFKLFNRYYYVISKHGYSLADGRYGYWVTENTSTNLLIPVDELTFFLERHEGHLDDRTGIWIPKPEEY